MGGKAGENETTKILTKIDLSMRLHDVLCDTAQKVNSNYNVQVTCDIMVWYGFLLFAGFYGYWMVVLEKFLLPLFP